jgi:hypothetical protein
MHDFVTANLPFPMRAISKTSNQTQRLDVMSIFAVAFQCNKNSSDQALQIFGQPVESLMNCPQKRR